MAIASDSLIKQWRWCNVADGTAQDVKQNKDWWSSFDIFWLLNVLLWFFPILVILSFFVAKYC
jgi:hypothetical protein